MSQSIRVYPPKDFFISFLATRGRQIVEDKEQVLHYFGDSERELRQLARRDHPDLVIINNPLFPVDEASLQKINYVIDPVSEDKDIYKTSEVRTNSPKLCQVYYRKLGLQKTMSIFYRPIEEQSSDRHTIRLLYKFFEFMRWS